MPTASIPLQPTWFRAGPARGAQSVDADARVIRQAAIVTEGEAKGHGVSLDSEFVDRVVQLGNASPKGEKARLGHPTLSGSDPIDTYLGRWLNFTRDTTADGRAIARADLHLSRVSESNPRGDLATYVLDMAQHEPDMFGTSIVFMPGRPYRRDAEGKKWFRFVRESMMDIEVWYEDENGKKRENSDGLSADLYATIESLHAADVVDEPAANDGLFSRLGADHLALHVTEFLDTHPEIIPLLHANPGIVEGFLARYESYRNPTTQEPPSPQPVSSPEPAGQPATSTTTKDRFMITYQTIKSWFRQGEDEADEAAEARLASLKHAFGDLAVVQEYFDAKLDVPEAIDALRSDYVDQLAAKDEIIDGKQAAISALQQQLADAQTELAAAKTQTQTLKDNLEERPVVVVGQASSESAPTPEQEWENNPDLQREFRSGKAYAGYLRAKRQQEQGRND